MIGRDGHDLSHLGNTLVDVASQEVGFIPVDNGFFLSRGTGIRSVHTFWILSTWAFRHLGILAMLYVYFTCEARIRA